MGKVGAFLKIDRMAAHRRPATETIFDYEEFTSSLPTDAQCEQASRCMNCGVAFCQGGPALAEISVRSGCPLQNLIPEFNDLLYRRRWDDAVGRLFLTNPFPEFTGRVCPSPCESACNLGLHNHAVTIHDNERALADYAWEKGMRPLPIAQPDAPLATVVGSGPAGLAAAWELTRRGWRVCVVDKADRPGGLLTYGIPAMKLPKAIVERRIQLMKDSGIVFDCGIDAADPAVAKAILDASDAVVLACGAEVARKVGVPGESLTGVVPAVDYLSESTRSLLENRSVAPTLNAEGKDVVVVGGGDTGVDCVAVALRQGARSVTQVIRAKRPADNCESYGLWPSPRTVYSQGYGQLEAEATHGKDPRIWSVDTMEFLGDSAGQVRGVALQDIAYDESGTSTLVEGSLREIPAQLVLVAKGFIGADPKVLANFEGSDKVHIAGDARLGASIVASAIADGLRAAVEIAG